MSPRSSGDPGKFAPFGRTASGGARSCPICGGDRLDRNGACETCGHNPTRACPRCGTSTTDAAQFCPNCGKRLAPKPRSTTAAGARLERRHLTVMFCDLVSSTELAASMNEEDYTDLIQTFQTRVAATIASFGGIVGRFMGDGAIAFFGYPQANEDDAERAIRAALSVVAGGYGALGAGLPVATRAGIAAGPVVVGLLMRDVGFSNVDAAGAAPNLAARLQTMAQSGTVLIDDQVRQMAARSFEFRDLGQRPVRGFADKLQLWQPLRPVPEANRFAARFRGTSAPLIGRGKEMMQLRDLWAAARKGSGRVVFLSGEPGIGKSRIIAQLLHDVIDPETEKIQLFCTPLGQGVSLNPIIHALEAAADFSAGEGGAAKLAKLERALPDAQPASLTLVADLLGLHVDGQLPKLQLAPHRIRERLLDALPGILLSLARRRPLVLVFEDAHWSDSASLEVLTATIERAASRPLFLIVTARPEFDPPWKTLPQLTSVVLPPLPADASAALVRSIGGDTLEEATVAEIVSRADGVPLFVEEITKAILESGPSGKAPAGSIRSSAPTSVPRSLHASLIARLDRLGGSRDILETAATIGRQFDARLLSLVGGRAQGGLQHALGKLAKLGLVERMNAPSSGLYRFRHSLIRDAAYGLIVRERRRKLHRRLAEVIERDAQDGTSIEPYILAYHWTEAAEPARAAEWWLRAGIKSMQRSMMSDAVVQINLGLGLVAQLEPGEASRLLEINLLVALGKALIASKGHAAPVVGETFARAHAQSRHVTSITALPTIVFCEWTHALLRAELDRADECAAELTQLSETSNDPVLRVIAHFATGVSRLPRGDFSGSIAEVGRGLAIFDPAIRARYSALVIGDARVVMRTYLSRARLCIGDLDGCERCASDGILEARRLGHVYTLCHALFQSGFVTANLEVSVAGAAGVPGVALGRA